MVTIMDYFGGLRRGLDDDDIDDGVDGMSCLLTECSFNMILMLSKLHLQRPSQCSKLLWNRMRLSLGSGEPSHAKKGN